MGVGAIKMAHSNLIATPEAVSIVAAERPLNVRMFEFVAVVDVWMPVIVKVLTGTFDAIMEALALYLLEFRWRCIPPTRSVLVSTRRRWRTLGLRLGRRGGQKQAAG